MYIQNATYKAVPTAGLTFPLAEGTVLTVGDVTGIVPENIAIAAPTGLIYLAVGGTIDLTSDANAGVSFTDAELNTLGGDFNFIPVTEAGGGSGSGAVYLTDTNGTLSATYSEISALIDAGTVIYLKSTQSQRSIGLCPLAWLSDYGAHYTVAFTNVLSADQYILYSAESDSAPLILEPDD